MFAALFSCGAFRHGMRTIFVLALAFPSGLRLGLTWAGEQGKHTPGP